jgi:tape measure domain-containing protein
MGDGIKFLIDLDSKTAGATAAGNALKNVENSADRANRQLEGMDHHGGMLTQNIFKAEFAMKALEAGAEVAKGAVKKVFDLIKDTINVGAGERREKMALTNLLGGHEEAEAALHYLDRFSQLSEFGEESTKRMGIELLNAGVKGETWKHTLAAIGDVASMSADKVAGADAALSSFMRMQETGKLDARILRGLHLNVKDVMAGLGDALGMSPKAVKKALEDGTVPAEKAFETVLRAIEKKTGHELGKNVLSAGQQLGAKLTHLKEIPDKIMKSVADSPGMDAIERSLDRVLESFDPSGVKGQNMVKGLSSMMESVGHVLESTDWAALTLRLGGVATTIGTWIGPLSKTAEIMVKILDVGIKIPGALTGMGEKIGDFFATRNLEWQREQERTIKNRNLTGEVTSVADMDAGKSSAHRQFELSEYDRMMASRAPAPNVLPDMSSLSGSARAAASMMSAPHIEGKAEVVVNVSSANSSPAEIGQAAKAGVESGMTKALEEKAQQAGVRSSRKRHQ